MVVYVRYCSKCRTKVSPQEIDRNQAYEYKDNCVCRKCFQKLPEKFQEKIKRYTERKRTREEAEARGEEVSEEVGGASETSMSTLEVLQNRPRKALARATEKSDRLGGYGGARGTGEYLVPDQKKNPFPIIAGVLIVAAVVILFIFSGGEPIPSPLKNTGKDRDKTPSRLGEPTTEWDTYLDVKDFAKDNPLELVQIRDKYLAILTKAPTDKWRQKVQDELSIVQQQIETAKKNGTLRRPRPTKKPTPPSQKRPDNSPTRFIASQRSQAFHKPSCEWGQKIAKRNLVSFPSREAAVRSGRRPCHECRP